jgi:hypothetical protein
MALISSFVGSSAAPAETAMSRMPNTAKACNFFMAFSLAQGRRDNFPVFSPPALHRLHERRESLLRVLTFVVADTIAASVNVSVGNPRQRARRKGQCEAPGNALP